MNTECRDFSVICVKLVESQLIVLFFRRCGVLHYRVSTNIRHPVLQTPYATLIGYIFLWRILPIVRSWPSRLICLCAGQTILIRDRHSLEL